MAILWTFELLLHLDQLFSSNLQSGDKLCTITDRIKYLSENVLFSQTDKTVTDIHGKPGNKKRKKSNTYGLVKKMKRTVSSNTII